jgi:hypothetical protein
MEIEPKDSTTEQIQRRRELADRLARRIVRLKLSETAVLFLESVRPLESLSGQALHFFAPLVDSFGHFTDYETLADLLEERGGIDLLLHAIEREEAANET